MTEIVSDLVAAGDGQRAGTEYQRRCASPAPDTAGYLRLAIKGSQYLRKPESPFNRGQWSHRTIGGYESTAERGSQLPPTDGWNPNGSIESWDMAGEAQRVPIDGMASIPNPWDRSAP